MLLLLLLTWVVLEVGLCDASCLFLRDDRTIRCRNSTLPDIAESLHILTRVVLNRPKGVDIEGGVAQFLPPLFQDLPINSSIQSVRVAGLGLRAVHDDAFMPLAPSLTSLDLSDNAFLQTPRAIVPLVHLVRLDLSKNRIRFLRSEEGVLERLSNLRELDLSRNLIGLARDGLQLRAPLSLSEFVVSPRSLVRLNLRGNRLATLPGQLAGQTGEALPDLETLDVSANAIPRIDGLKESAPGLRELNLRANKVKGLTRMSLPGVIESLDLSENPFACDCGAMWLRDWSDQNGTSLRAPGCASPPSLKDTPLDQVAWAEVCPDDETTTLGTTLAVDDGMHLSSGTASITVQWAVPKGAWAVVYRPASDSPHQMRLANPGARAQISGLRPSTPYVVCLARGVPGGKYTLEPDKCRKVFTKSEALDVKTEVEEIVYTSDSIEVSWKLNWMQEDVPEDMSVRHEWTIRIRRTGSDNFTEIPVYDITAPGDMGGQTYEYKITDLSPRTYYDICLLDVEHRPLETQGETPSGHETVICQTVQTSGNYGPEIAGVTLACLFCVASIFLVLYLAKRKRLLPGKVQQWCSRCKDRPRPVGCSSLYASSRLDSANFDSVMRSQATRSVDLPPPAYTPNQSRLSSNGMKSSLEVGRQFGVAHQGLAEATKNDDDPYGNIRRPTYTGGCYANSGDSQNHANGTANTANQSYLHDKGGAKFHTGPRSHLHQRNETTLSHQAEATPSSNLYTLSRSHMGVSTPNQINTASRENGYTHSTDAGFFPKSRIEPHTLARSFVESWNTLRLPDFSVLERPDFHSLGTAGGYRDALTSVTIYSSGYSEC